VSTQLITKSDTKIRHSYERLTMACAVTLSDLDQIIIEVEDKEYDYSQRNYVLKGLKKVRLEELHYDLSQEQNEFRLDTLTVRGFRKDKGLRARTEHVGEITAGIISQIPDHYHDRAKDFFFEASQTLLKKINQTIDNDLKIIVHNGRY
jgi:hypothetical protein